MSGIFNGQEPLSLSIMHEGANIKTNFRQDVCEGVERIEPAYDRVIAGCY
jgi:hypothetical protein